MSERTKTSLMLPNRLTPEVEKVRAMLGVSKSDFAAMGMALLAVHLAPLEKTPRKREQLLAALEREFQKIFKEALAKLY